jgi:hypothetical protein
VAFVMTQDERTSLQLVIGLLQRLLQESPVTPPAPQPRRKIAWGAKVSEVFRDRVWWIADTLGFDPDWIMSIIAWETGRTFSASVKNAAGSGATGLIQFMPTTAVQLGTTVAQLAAMKAEDQLNYVYKYFSGWAGKVHSLSDLYMCVLWPKAVGQPDNYVLFEGGTIAYRQNAGLDTNRDTHITKAEVSGKLYAMQAEGANFAA